MQWGDTRERERETETQRHRKNRRKERVNSVDVVKSFFVNLVRLI